MIAGSDGGACSSEPGRDRVLAILRHRSYNPPREALRSRPRRRPRPRILASGVLEYWSIGVLRLLRIVPRERGVRSPFQGEFMRPLTQGPKLSALGYSVLPFHGKIALAPALEPASRTGTPHPTGRSFILPAPHQSPFTYHFSPSGRPATLSTPFPQFRAMPSCRLRPGLECSSPESPHHKSAPAAPCRYRQVTRRF